MASVQVERELTDSFSRLRNDYVLVAAIDFGTTFSGYAFSFKTNKEDIRMFSNWGTCVGIAQAYKTPTCVLTDKDGKFVSFGFEAQSQFSNMTTDQAGDHSFFERFKMHLHNKSTLSRTTFITARGGQIRSALDIFAMSLKFLKGHLMNTIEAQTDHFPREDHIRWVITVPAIWTDASKQFMREASCQAGIITEVNSKNLIISLEPEAASLYCRSVDLNHFVGAEKTDTKMAEGTKYLVLDCGGGTVDVTAHHLMSRGRIAELYQANGGNLGGTRVDENFVNLLRSIFGTAAMNRYQSMCPADWLQMMSNFERLKRGINPDNKSTTTNIPISFEFAEIYAEVVEKSIKKSISDEWMRRGVSFTSGMLRLPYEVVYDLFKPIVNAILEHVQKLMTETGLKDITHFLLVGGFSESPVLQDAIKRHFRDRVKILVPGDASLCVVKGAVTFGQYPDAIVVRRARKTYGTDVYPKYDPQKHPNPNKVKDFDGVTRAERFFRVWIQKGEEIELGQGKTFSHTPVSANQKNMAIGVFHTEDTDPKYTDDEDVVRIGGITVDLPGTGLDRKVEVKLKFGGTEITVEGRDMRPGGAVANADIDFLSD